jgi:hypothetical protein
MIKVNINENDIKEFEKEINSNLKEISTAKEDEKKDFINLNLKNKPNEDNSNNIGIKNSKTNKISDKNLINDAILNNPRLNKVKTFNNEKRTDKFGNMIIHGGKQKVTFIDRVSKKNLTEVVKIENFKEYNKMEEVNNKNQGDNCSMNNCCSLL